MIDLLERILGRLFRRSQKKKKPPYPLMNELRERARLARERGELSLPVKLSEYDDLLAMDETKTGGSLILVYGIAVRLIDD